MTELETKVLETIKKNLLYGPELSEDNNAAYFSDVPWDMDTKIVRGVLTSLSNKGLIVVSREEEETEIYVQLDEEV